MSSIELSRAWQKGAAPADPPGTSRINSTAYFLLLSLRVVVSRNRVIDQRASHQEILSKTTFHQSNHKMVFEYDFTHTLLVKPHRKNKTTDYAPNCWRRQKAANTIFLRPGSVQLYHCRERKDWTETCTWKKLLGQEDNKEEQGS